MPSPGSADGSAGNPIHIKQVYDTEIHPVRVGLMVILSLLPVGIAMWMQFPALRQAVKMRALRYGWAICAYQENAALETAVVWRKARLKLGSTYQRVSM